MDWGIAVASTITGAFGIPLTLMQLEQMRRTKTNHGKKLGVHVEDASRAAEAAALGAAKLAADLSLYKLEQERNRAEDKAEIQKYVAADAIAHADLQALILRRTGPIGDPEERP